ncbi:MAG TPA: ATP-binding protein [Candidatus Polarisedimenticolia bacterium]|nr:ATP-binding protein [Candidatus Polarisedimenticolia bacterium]
MNLRLNLKVKFTLTICCLLAFSTITLGWFFLLQVEKTALRGLREKGTIVAQGLADGSELGVLAHNAELLRLVLGSLPENGEVVYAGVADARGMLLAERRNPTLVQVPGWAAAVTSEGDESDHEPEMIPTRPGRGEAIVYYITVPIRANRGAPIGEEVGIMLGEEHGSRDNGRIGTVCVGISAAQVIREVGGLRRGLVFATLAVLVVGLAIAVLLVRVIVEPIKQLVHATNRIAAGDLAILLQHRGQDEIGALSESFNQMTLNLRDSREALERINAELEKKVQDRSRALQEAQYQLVQAEKMSVVGQLVSGVAHELNNPLAGVLGYSQLLQRKGAEGEVARGLQKIEAEAERCKRIVQNLLIFARKHKPRKTLLNLNAVIESTLELRAYHLKVDNVTVIRDLDPSLPRTMADMNQIQQVLMNMINNAQHAMADVGRQRMLTMRTRRAAGRVLIQVTDTGSGIAPENLTRIFDPFFTTKEVGRGTGLGLSICYGIVQEHRGEIRVESVPGAGTTFIIDLPVQDEGAGTEPEPASLQEWMGGSPTRKGRILLVDDEKTILDVIGDVLRMDGHHVETTTNGSAALGRLQRERFDVILTDLKMPGMSGQELFTRLAELDGPLSRRLVFTTGDLASPDTLSFLERTGNAYLQKPFDLNAVRRVVQTILAEATTVAARN